MSDVVVLPVITTEDIPPERVLNAALAEGLSDVVVIGRTEDGDEYFATSTGDAGEILWLLERTKHRLMCVND